MFSCGTPTQHGTFIFIGNWMADCLLEDCAIYERKQDSEMNQRLLPVGLGGR